MTHLLRAVRDLREKRDRATPGPWRKRRAPLDREEPAAPPACYGIAAGRETWHQNKGLFHPEDARYPVDEIDVVRISYDRDYGYPEGAIEEEADAEFIAAAGSFDLHALEHELERLQSIEEAARNLRKGYQAGEALGWFWPALDEALTAGEGTAT